MQKTLLLGLLLAMMARAGFAQYGGGVAGSAGTAGVSRDDSSPAYLERLKRQSNFADGTANYIEASVLMNVKADEYVAVFGVIEEGKTPAEATEKMEATLSKFQTSIKSLGVKDDDVFVDFVVQNRIYAYQLEATVAKEELVGFELKKNVSIHFKDKALVDRLVVAAAQAEIYDLIKVDYVVQDMAGIQAKLQAQTAAIIRNKAERYQSQLGLKLPAPTQVIADKPSVYFPIEQYDSYAVTGSEDIYNINRSNYTVQNARKSRTTYFNPLSGDGYDAVINPVIIEPVVQFTTYMKVKFGGEKKGKNK